MKEVIIDTTVRKKSNGTKVQAKGHEFDHLKSFVQPYFEQEFPENNFEQAWNEYSTLNDFKISDNVERVGGISEQAHYIMRTLTEYYLAQAFRAMKIDMNDPNVGGEKGTPYRMAKMYCGSGLEDDSELLSGRWQHKPQITSFPNSNNQKFPITKRVDIVSVCSHHVAPFSTMFRDGAYALISYIPSETVLGISKLQRLVDWVARRGHLQEDLTVKIYNEMSKAAGTHSVFVRLVGLVHTCESLRGTQSKDGAFTSEYYGGDFESYELRRQVTAQ